MKRTFDIMLSAAGLLTLLPLFAVIAVLVKAGSRGPVFFRQKRMGRNFKPFYLYKFRTMVDGADKKGPLVTTGGDSRVTGAGRILRKTKLDELPQLINVFMGDMSLVGPRPEVEKYVMLYEPDYRVVLSIRPGITDISSIEFRDEESVLKAQENPEEYYRKVLLPIKIGYAKDYIRNMSFFFDMKLIFITILKVLNLRAPAISGKPVKEGLGK
jgi:lipopolysaccharide/colanic/teichoic acid biosynthesis glycosyltransferase